MNDRCDLLFAMLAALLILVSIPGVAYAGPLEDAEEAVTKDDYATAIPIYRSHAEKGNVSAQKRLGFFYVSPEVTKSYGEVGQIPDVMVKTFMSRFEGEDATNPHDITEAVA